MKGASTASRVFRALVVDDLADARRILGDCLVRVGFDPAYAEDGLAGLDAFEQCQPDLILTDKQMPRLDGIEFVRRIRESSDVPVIMISAFGSISDCEQAMRVGVNRYLEFRRDLDRVGGVACELVGCSARLEAGSTSLPNSLSTLTSPANSAVSVTATQARAFAQEELRRALQRQLVACRGNVAEMARRMGKDRSTVRYHLHRFGMLNTEIVHPS